MCDPVSLTLVAATVLTAGSQVYGGLAANALGKYENRVAQENARREEAKVGDAVERGNIEQMRRYRLAAQQQGEQRAQAGLFGLDLGIGTTLDQVIDTGRIAGEDVAIIGENTRREIGGFDINAANYRAQGAAARAAGKGALVGSILSAGGTLLGGASQVGKQRAGSGGGSASLTARPVASSTPSTYFGTGTIR